MSKYPSCKKWLIVFRGATKDLSLCLKYFNSREIVVRLLTPCGFCLKTVADTIRDVSYQVKEDKSVKVMPSSLLQSDGGAFIHMIMVGTFTIGSRVL